VTAAGAPPGPPPPVVLFDGVCNLCHGAVRFIIARDPAARFRFASLQSPVGQALLRDHRLGPGLGPDSLVLVEGGRAYTRSAAVLRIARGLRWPWPAAGALALVPRPLRDAAYDLVARRRYRWFGRQAECPLPTPDLARRFID
jgi:predicted DCC family thiol-disulfide oxidoreductase YuxK